MNFVDLKDYVGTLAVVSTILQFLSGIIICKQYVINRTTAETSSLPFTCGVLSAALWLLYGLHKRDDKIIVVNTIGVVLMLFYSAIFYVYTFKKSAILRQIFATAASLLFVTAYISSIDDQELILNRLGLLASILTLITIAAPMSKLLYVIRVKSTECLPFPLIVMSFFVSTLWFIYGQIEEDIYISTVNFIGAALAFAQLSLFVIYPSTPASPSLLKGMIA